MGQYVLEIITGRKTLIDAENDEEAISKAQEIVDQEKFVATLYQIRKITSFTEYQKKNPCNIRDLKDILLYDE